MIDCCRGSSTCHNIARVCSSIWTVPFSHYSVTMLEAHPTAQYAVVARMIPSLKRELGGLRYERLNPSWEIAELEHHPHDWTRARRCIVARKLIKESDPKPSLFVMKHYAYRAWHTNLTFTPGCGTSTMAAPEWSDAFGKSGRIMRCRRFPLVLLRPMHSIWK